MTRKVSLIVTSVLLLLLTVCPEAVFAFRTSYAPRPGKLAIWGQDGYMRVQDEDAQPPNKPLPDGNDFVAVSGGKNMAFTLRADGVGILWGVNKYGGWGDLAAAQPLDANGNLIDPNDAFRLITSGRGHWAAVKKTGYLVCGGGYEKGGAGALVGTVPTQFQAVLDYEIPLGGEIVDISGGGGYTIVLLRRHNEDQITGLPGGRVYGWSYETYWGEDKWNDPAVLKGVNGGFIDCSTGNKQGGAVLRYDGTSEAFGWNNHSQSNEPSYSVLDIQRGGYKLIWICDDADRTVIGNPSFGPLVQNPARPFVALSIGYAFHSILQADGSVRLEGTWSDPEGRAAVEARRDIMAVAQGNGVGIAVVDADGYPVVLELGAGRAPYPDSPSKPVFTSTPITTATEDVLYTYDANAIDPLVEPNEGAITYRLVLPPDGMTIDANTGLIEWTPTNDQAAQQQIVYIKASDGIWEGDQGFHVTVANTNDAPVADAGPDVSMLRGWPVTLDGSGSSDPDLNNPSGETLEYEWDFDTSDGIGVDSNEISPSIIYSDAGTYTAQLTVRDAADAVSTDTVTVDIYPPRDIYVAPDGNDSNAGTISEPFATIGRALLEAYPTETVVLRAGTYTGSVTVTTDEVIIRNYQDEIAIVDGDGADDSVFVISAEEVTISGIGITNPKSYKWGISAAEPNLTVENCSIYGCTLASNDAIELEDTATGAMITGCDFGIPPDGNSNPATDFIKRYGIKSYATDVTIEDCNFANIPNNYALYFHVGADRTTIGGCEIRGCKNGMYFPEVYDCVISNNLITGLTGTKVIENISGAAGQNFTISFNTFADNSGANAIDPPSGANPDAVGDLKYNIITGNAYGIRYDGFTNSYNLINGNASGDYSGNAVPGTGEVSADPLFVGDYLLDLYSPAVDLADITAVQAGLDEMTTRLDTAPDFADADAGYHRATDFTGAIPPMAYIDADLEAGEAPLLVSFDANDSFDPNPGESIVAWDWDFGDGSTDSGETISHVFQDGNDYTVTLTVTSSTTATGVATKDISVYGVETGGTNVLFIVSNAASPVANDQNMKAWLESNGYTVTLADDNDDQTTLEAAAASNDVVIISASIAGTALQQKANAIAVGMVVLDPVTIADGSNGMGFAEGGTTKLKDTIIIDDNTHFITGPYSGEVQIFTSSPSVTCGQNLATSASWLATAKDLPTWSGLFAFDPNAELLSGFGYTPARRVSGLLGTNINNMTDDGKDLMLRAIQWAAGGGGGSAENRPPVPVINVATTAEPNEVLTFNGSGSYDPDPGDSVTSWTWDFGDGATATGAIVTHSYTETNNYTVTLTVEDTHEATDSGTETIYVSQPGKNLLIIVSNPTSPTTNDQNLIGWLQSRGHTVTLIDDIATEAELNAAADANDAVVVSYSIAATALQQKANAISKGMVVLDPVTVSDASNGMGLAEDGATKQKNTILVTDDTHYITSSFPSQVQIFTASPITTCGRYLATGATGLATAQDLPDWSAILVVEAGGELISGFGTAPARRAAGFLGGNINNMTEDGKVLLLRAIEWVSQ